MANGNKAIFPCSICNYDFNNPRDLGTHILMDHCSTSTPIKEEEIEEKTPLVDNSSTNEEWAKSLTRSGTSESLPSLIPSPEEKKQKFMMHRVSDSSFRYICLLCSKMYTSRYNIRMHMNLHSGNNVHCCDYCGRAFAHKHVYESHVRTHTGERPFGCSKCGRAFGDRSNCTSHQKKCKGGIYSESTPPSLTKDPSKMLAMLANNNNNNNNGSPSSLTNNNNTSFTLPTEPIPLEQIVEESNFFSKYEKKSKSFPHIISVQSVDENDLKDDLEDDLEDENEEEDEEIDDNDLEEIQIEPDIIMDEEDETGHNKKKPFENEDYSIFTCSFCNCKFDKGQRDLIEHVSQQHVLSMPTKPENKDYERGFFIFYYSNRPKCMCLSCGKIFATEDQVKIHIKIHLEDNIYNCRFCNTIFSDFSVFETHIKSHTEEFKYNCKYCDNSFMSRMVLVQHVKTCSKNDELHQSSVKAYWAPEESQNGVKKPRRSMPPLKPITESSVEREEKEGEEEEEEVEEDETEENFNEYSDDYVPDNNSNNVISKTAIMPAPSLEEKKIGFCLRQLKNGQTRFICIKCGKHYTTNYNMRQHLNIHTGKGLHTCRYCNRSFTHKHVWETHERIHTGERPFKCSFCPKDFADRSNYNSHRKLCAISKVKR